MKNAKTKTIYLLNHQGRSEDLVAFNECPACNKGMLYDDISIQHCTANHDWRRKKYPLFIDSILNLKLIHRSCNTTSHRSFGRISDYNAERYEEFLQRHPLICQWVNNPI